MRATIKDIAKQAGVSITTVSLVLNGKAYKIPDQTKKIVLDTARELNYTPNQMAVGLVKKRSQTIGLIVPNISNTYFCYYGAGGRRGLSKIWKCIDALQFRRSAQAGSGIYYASCRTGM